MPLPFESVSHGEIAFGFFNIETDMALLNQYFFFASDFCALVSRAAGNTAGPMRDELPSHVLGEESQGDLAGAIRGLNLNGLIGESYRLFPFPSEPAAFRQNPEGYKTRDLMEATAGRYGQPFPMTVAAGEPGASISMGEYVFARQWFHELIRYVWIGGYPRWKDAVRPPYVLDMASALKASKHPLFKGLILAG